jgi:hypothetical protein
VTASGRWFDNRSSVFPVFLEHLRTNDLQQGAEDLVLGMADENVLAEKELIFPYTTKPKKLKPRQRSSYMTLRRKKEESISSISLLEGNMPKPSSLMRLIIREKGKTSCRVRL